MPRPITAADKATIFNDDADPQQVAFALNRVQFGEPAELQAMASRVRELLDHRDAEVRGEAAKILVGSLGSEKDLDRVIALLLEDRDDYWVGRASASLALAAYAKAHPAAAERVLRILARAVKLDPEWGVQLAAYQDFLRLTSPNANFDVGDEVFDRESMVDWALLQPYLADS